MSELVDIAVYIEALEARILKARNGFQNLHIRLHTFTLLHIKLL